MHGPGRLPSKTGKRLPPIQYLLRGRPPSRCLFRRQQQDKVPIERYVFPDYRLFPKQWLWRNRRSPGRMALDSGRGNSSVKLRAPRHAHFVQVPSGLRPVPVYPNPAPKIKRTQIKTSVRSCRLRYSLRLNGPGNSWESEIPYLWPEKLHQVSAGIPCGCQLVSLICALDPAVRYRISSFLQ